MTTREDDTATPVSDEEHDDIALDVVAYEWIRDGIINGTIKHGSRIRERDIAEQLGVSRIPVRESLPRLEAEGYIKTLHRRGAVVTPMRLQEVTELFTLRSSLEVLAARLAAEQCAAGASGEHLLECLAAAERATRDDDTRGIATSTFELHDAIVLLSGNELLWKVMSPIRGRLKRLFSLITERGDHETHDEHRAICNAIVTGQAERAAALALAHVEHSRFQTMPIARRVLGD